MSPVSPLRPAYAITPAASAVPVHQEQSLPKLTTCRLALNAAAEASSVSFTPSNFFAGPVASGQESQSKCRPEAGQPQQPVGNTERMCGVGRGDSFGIENAERWVGKRGQERRSGRAPPAPRWPAPCNKRRSASLSPLPRGEGRRSRGRLHDASSRATRAPPKTVSAAAVARASGRGAATGKISALVLEERSANLPRAL